jgi:hypothetical protein
MSSRLVTQAALVGRSGVGKTAPLQNTSTIMNHNRSLLVIAESTWTSKVPSTAADADVDSGVNNTNNPYMKHLGAELSIKRVAFSARYDSGQATFDSMSLFQTEPNGSKKRKDPAECTESVLQVNDEAEDYFKTQATSRKLLELTSAPDKTMHTTITGTTVLDHPSYCALVAGHAPFIAATWMAPAQQENGFAARFNYTLVHRNALREFSMVAAKQPLPLSLVTLACQLLCVCDVGLFVTGSRESESGSFASQSTGGPAPDGETKRFFLSVEVPRLEEGSNIAVVIPAGSVPGVKIDYPLRGGPLQGRNANLNMKGDAIVSGGLVAEAGVTKDFVLTTVAGVTVDSAYGFCEVVRHVTAFGDLSPVVDIKTSSDGSSGGGSDSGGSFGGGEVFPTSVVSTVDWNEGGVLHASEDGVVGPASKPSRSEVEVKIKAPLLEGVTLEHIDCGPGQIRGGIRVVSVTEETGLSQELFEGAELFAYSFGNRKVIFDDDDDDDDESDFDAHAFAKLNSSAVFFFLIKHPRLELVYIKVTKQYSMLQQSHDRLAAMADDLANCDIKDTKLVKIMHGAIAKQPLWVLRAAALYKLNRVALELVQGADFQLPRQPGLPTAEDVSALTDAIIKRCTSIGRTNKPVLMGTRHKGTLPRCLCHEIGVADVTAALTQQDHDLVALVLIAAEDNELTASAGASLSGGGGSGSGPTTQSILDSPLGSLLDTGGVSATAELILFRQKVLLAEGGSRCIGATEEGRFGGGIFLSTAMIKNHYRGAA